MGQTEKDACRPESYSQETDFLCERQLKALDPELHKRYRSSVFAMDMLLANYKTVFPFFTNHTFEHSAQVINYCNILVGQQNIERLNADELYILLMGACLHDIGMGISPADFQAMKDAVPGVDAYMEAHPDDSIAEVTRSFHQEFSAQFIRKYRDLFEIPSEEHLYCICQIARGHRKLDLLDETEFDPHYQLPGGAVVHLPYLAGLVKMADELDVTADRNLLFDYTNLEDCGSRYQILCYKCHKALERLSVEKDALVLWFHAEEQEVRDEIADMDKKVQKTFREFSAAVLERTDFSLVQTSVRFQERL